MIKVKRALISVSDKKGLIPFAKGLHDLGVEILSTGGTARHLKGANIEVVEVSDYTDFPEMLDGRVKTLHPKIHGGLLALRDNQEHMNQLEKNDIGLIDMVVVNLYPFESVVKKKNVTLEEAIENIDIGGPSMLRSAAKNYKSVCVICNPKRYKDILKELDVNSGLLSDSILMSLSVEAFQHTAQYDSIISHFLNKRDGSEEFGLFPKDITFKYEKLQDLRYGENPHQKGAFYGDYDQPFGLAKLKQLHGKELSFNNILDLNAAIDFVKEFSSPAAVVIKHNNPTGVSEDRSLTKAFKDAYACDAISAFGGIIGVNRKVDAKTARLILKSGFMECVVAYGFEREAYKILSEKKRNLRLVEINFNDLDKNRLNVKQVQGGLLLQEVDDFKLTPDNLKVATKNKLTKSQIDSILFGWKVVKHVRSNAIILVKGKKTVGIGCGQTSRVESVRIAIEKAGKEAKGSILISDAFIPKTDNVQLAAKAGIKAIVQTGGSIADDDVIKEAQKRKVTMVMTGVRHFKH